MTFQIQTDDQASCPRRAFLRDGSLLLLGAAGLAHAAQRLPAAEPEPRLRLGLVTDLHYADKPAAGTRFYRETLAKFAEAAAEFEKARPAAIVELGDLIDAADSVEAEKKYLKRIQQEFASLPGEKHYVLGNHCVATLTKEEFLDGVGQASGHGSFDLGDYHFVLLDACFRADGKPYGRNNSAWTDANIPAEQVAWLRDDLKATARKTIVFVHQRLDVRNSYGVKNATQVRQVLQESEKVLAVFQGHSHKNDLNTIGDIHYCTLAAMIEGTGPESNSYSLLDVLEGEVLRVSGFRKQADYQWNV